jgi:hypothetical protein
VIGAADAVILVAAQEQRRQTVRAQVVHDADAATSIAEGDQLLAEQHQAHLRTVGHELRGKACGDPELPHELSHRSRAPDPGEQLVLYRSDHPPSPALVPIEWITVRR